MGDEAFRELSQASAQRALCFGEGEEVEEEAAETKSAVTERFNVAFDVGRSERGEASRRRHGGG